MQKELQTAFSPRQYMVSEDFEVYYYNDLNFSGVDPHVHDYYEFYFFVEGDITMYIDGLPHRLSFGDVVFIPPGIPHSLTCGDRSIPYRRFVFWVSKEYCRQLQPVSPCYLYVMEQASLQQNYCCHCDSIEFNTLQHKIFQLIEEISSNRYGKLPKIMLCVNDLLLQINREYYEKNHEVIEDSSHSIFEALLQLIDENLENDVSLDYLANRLYMSKYHISHVFKERLELSIHQYIIKRRLTLCRDAFLCGTPLAKVHEKYGFKDYSSFYRAFVKEYGISPKEYKEQKKLMNHYYS